ncbi:MAG: hypothetical protein ABIP54_01650 [Candidatus Andersenbacteria bacterium]
MKEPKEHLDIDLEFLDKKEPTRVALKKPDDSKKSGPNWRYYDSNKSEANSMPVRKYNWKNIIIIGGIILFLCWIVFLISSDSSSSSNSTNAPSIDNIGSKNILTDGGQTFRCADSNYDRALQLKPSTSLGGQLANESDSLDARIATNKAKKTELDVMYVDESNQYAIDNYNSMVESYNAERQRLITVTNSWQQRNDAFNKQVDTYNNFLDTNCSPK